MFLGDEALIPVASICDFRFCYFVPMPIIVMLSLLRPSAVFHVNYLRILLLKRELVDTNLSGFASP